jgi:hypothetical protein
MASTTQSSNNGIGFCTVLFLIFLTLKLTGNIAWSWWWGAAPIWIPIGLVLAILAGVGVWLGLSVLWRRWSA